MKHLFLTTVLVFVFFQCAGVHVKKYNTPAPDTIQTIWIVPFSATGSLAHWKAESTAMATFLQFLKHKLYYSPGLKSFNVYVLNEDKKPTPDSSSVFIEGHIYCSTDYNQENQNHNECRMTISLLNFEKHPLAVYEARKQFKKNPTIQIKQMIYDIMEKMSF